MRVEDELYYRNVQSASNYTSVNAAGTAAAKETSSAQGKDDAVSAVGAAKPNTDRTEFSQDTKVINKMSDSERAELVKSLKADMDNQMTRFTNMMMQTFQKQGITGLTAQSDSFWRTIASGNFTVDAQTKADAKEAISEDGYWGVKQTSERIFNFAQALAGDDPAKMKEMQEAVEKGYKQATQAWGKSLPSISQDTMNAVNNLFSDYYKSKEED